MVKGKLEEQGSRLLKGFRGCKLALDYLIESRFNVVAKVDVGPFQLIAEGSFCGGSDAILSGGNGISDIQSILSAGCCYLIATELRVVGDEVHFFSASILIDEELGSFASGEHYEAWIRKIIVPPGSFCVAEALC